MNSKHLLLHGIPHLQKHDRALTLKVKMLAEPREAILILDTPFTHEVNQVDGRTPIATPRSPPILLPNALTAPGRRSRAPRPPGARRRPLKPRAAPRRKRRLPSASSTPGTQPRRWTSRSTRNLGRLKGADPL